LINQLFIIGVVLLGYDSASERLFLWRDVCN